MFKNKVVIITGASSGIGLACAKEFGKNGCKIVLAARNIELLNKIVIELSDHQIESIAVRTDVTIEDDCKKLIDITINKFGKIDILINNAGISMRASFIDLQMDVLKKLMDVNFWGTVYCSKFAIPYLLQTKGSVIGISSIAGFKGLPGRTGYSASKFAMNGFLDTLRIENLKTGLHVMIVAPGFTTSNIRKSALGPDGQILGETPRDESKMMSAERVAQHIITGIRFKRRNLILTFWQGKVFILLHRILPKLIDQLAYREFAREPNSPLK